MAKLTNEVKTGAAVLVSILLLAGLLYKMGDLNIRTSGYVVKTQFGFAAGIRKFAPVRLAGVEIGEVKNIAILYQDNQTIIEAALWVRDDVKLRSDSRAMVRTMGLMGEKYVEIESGSSNLYLKPGEAVQGEDPAKLEDLLKKGDGIADQLDSTLIEIRAAAKEAKEVLQDAKPKTARILTNLDGLLEKNHLHIDRILENLAETSEYFKEFAEDIKYHPWKVLAKGQEKSPQELEKLRAERKAKKIAEQTAETTDLKTAATVAPSSPPEKNKAGSKSKTGKKGLF